MSDTPQTDAVEVECAGWEKLRWVPQVVVKKLFAHARQLEREIEMLTNAGVIECAVRNKAVAEYMRHWEGRTLTAEGQLVVAKNLISGALPHVLDGELYAAIEEFIA